MTSPSQQIFSEEMAKNYDASNSHLAPISENLHFLIKLILKELPDNAQILCVGAGTGAEILALANEFPNWTFMALEPSSAMLDVCKERVAKAGFGDRCEFFNGFLEQLPGDAKYDSVISLLVAHFIAGADRKHFYKNMSHRLRSGGYFIDGEISYDLESEEFPSMLNNWRAMQLLRGASSQVLERISQQLKEMLSVLAPYKVEALLCECGIERPIQFFQSFMIVAWYWQKK